MGWPRTCCQRQTKHWSVQCKMLVLLSVLFKSITYRYSSGSTTSAWWCLLLQTIQSVSSSYQNIHSTTWRGLSALDMEFTVQKPPIKRWLAIWHSFLVPSSTEYRFITLVARQQGFWKSVLQKAVEQCSTESSGEIRNHSMRSYHLIFI